MVFRSVLVAAFALDTIVALPTTSVDKTLKAAAACSAESMAITASGNTYSFECDAQMADNEQMLESLKGKWLYINGGSNFAVMAHMAANLAESGYASALDPNFIDVVMTKGTDGKWTRTYEKNFKLTLNKDDAAQWVDWNSKIKAVLPNAPSHSADSVRVTYIPTRFWADFKHATALVQSAAGGWPAAPVQALWNAGQWYNLCSKNNDYCSYLDIKGKAWSSVKQTYASDMSAALAAKPAGWNVVVVSDCNPGGTDSAALVELSTSAKKQASEAGDKFVDFTSISSSTVGSKHVQFGHMDNVLSVLVLQASFNLAGVYSTAGVLAATGKSSLTFDSTCDVKTAPLSTCSEAEAPGHGSYAPELGGLLCANTRPCTFK